jgi:Mg-chelatase subunit ChlD
VKLRIVSAHDYGSTKNLAISEVAIIESPQQQPSLVDAVKKNIALAGSGGGISLFSSHWLKEEGGVSQLIDGTDETPGWRTHLDRLPQEVTFSFRENREAWIDFIAIQKSTQHDSATWPKRISIETSSSSPVSDFRPIGEFVLPRTAAEWITPIQGGARYVKLKILENHGGPYTSLGEVRIVEGEAPNYRSVLFNGLRKAEELVASSLPHPAWPEREPNEVPAEATTVPLGESFGGIIEYSSDHDVYSFAVPGDRRMALAVDLTGVPYLSTLIQLKNDAGEELRREEPQGHSTQNASFAWNVDVGDYYLEVTRPPMSVVLLWDGSGSMAGQTENLRAAVRAYLNRLGDDEHINLVRFAGIKVDVFLDQFTNDPLKAWSAVKDEFTAKGGTPLYKAIEKGIELLEGRSGNKAVILMTDGVGGTEHSPSLLEAIRTASVRFYTIGLGPDQDVFFLDRASNGKRLLADLSRASGGRQFVVHSSEQLPAIYERIGRELQSPTHYRLTLRQSEETGGLTVIANRDTASDEDTSTTSAGSKKDDGKKHPPVEEQPSGAAVHLEIIFDASGSMKIAVGGESKIVAAKRALKEVLKSLDLDHIALAFRAYGFDTSIEYGKETTCKNTELLVGFDEGSPSSIIRAANPLQTYGHTPIAKSLRLAGEDLGPFKEEHPTILLISDGKDSCDGNPVAEIERLRARGIDVKVHIVGFDLDDAARSQLQHIANAGNGNYYDAKDYHDLSESLNQVAETITQVADSSLQEKNEDDSTIPPEKQAFDVLDDTGRRVAQGRVGDTITELVPGIYTVLVYGLNSVIKIEKVHVDSEEITLVEL